MLTPEEAVAKYRKAVGYYTLTVQVGTSIAINQAGDALDAAVCDAMLAAGALACPSCPPNCVMCAETWKAAILAAFQRATKE